MAPIRSRAEFRQQQLHCGGTTYDDYIERTRAVFDAGVTLREALEAAARSDDMALVKLIFDNHILPEGYRQDTSSPSLASFNRFDFGYFSSVRDLEFLLETLMGFAVDNNAIAVLDYLFTLPVAEGESPDLSSRANAARRHVHDILRPRVSTGVFLLNAVFHRRRYTCDVFLKHKFLRPGVVAKVVPTSTAEDAGAVEKSLKHELVEVISYDATSGKYQVRQEIVYREKINARHLEDGWQNNVALKRLALKNNFPSNDPVGRRLFGLTVDVLSLHCRNEDGDESSSVGPSVDSEREQAACRRMDGSTGPAEEKPAGPMRRCWCRRREQNSKYLLFPRSRATIYGKKSSSGDTSAGEFVVEVSARTTKTFLISRDALVVGKDEFAASKFFEHEERVWVNQENASHGAKVVGLCDPTGDYIVESLKDQTKIRCKPTELEHFSVDVTGKMNVVVLGPSLPYAGSVQTEGQSRRGESGRIVNLLGGSSRKVFFVQFTDGETRLYAAENIGSRKSICVIRYRGCTKATICRGISHL